MWLSLEANESGRCWHRPVPVQTAPELSRPWQRDDLDNADGLHYNQVYDRLKTAQEATYDNQWVEEQSASQAEQMNLPKNHSMQVELPSSQNLRPCWPAATDCLMVMPPAIWVNFIISGTEMWTGTTPYKKRTSPFDEIFASAFLGAVAPSLCS